MTDGPDAATPIGSPGTVHVVELVRYDDLGRRTTEQPEIALDLSRTEMAGRVVSCLATGWRRSAAVDGDVLVSLDLERDPGATEEGGWSKPVDLFGEPTRVTLRSDSGRGSALRGPLRYLEIGDGRWCWHFVGGRVAGEQLVLTRGAEPGGEPVVTVWPAAQGRALGKPKGGATADRHVTSWTSDASLGEVVLAELLAGAKLDAIVDYRAARMTEGVQELTGYVPRPEANTE